MTDNPSGGKEIALEVAGMSCMMCVKHVTRALQEVPGVSRADVTLSPPRAVVRYDPSMAGPDAMIAAIRKAGYDAKA